MITSLPFPLKFLLVFGFVSLSDVCWTRYFLAIQDRRAVAAGLWAASTATIAAVAIVEYTKDWRLIVAAVLGSFVGTSLTVMRSRVSSRTTETVDS